MPAFQAHRFNQLNHRITGGTFVTADQYVTGNRVVFLQVLPRGLLLVLRLRAVRRNLGELRALVQEYGFELVLSEE